MNEMKEKNVCALDEEFETVEKRVRKTVDELIKDYNEKGLRPQLQQFILEDVVSWASENGDALTVHLYLSKREFKEKGGKKIPFVSKANSKMLLQQFRDRHFAKFATKSDKKEKEIKFSDKEKAFLALEEKLKGYAA